MEGPTVKRVLQAGFADVSVVMADDLAGRYSPGGRTG
jgi:hypothetical protein